MKVGVSIKIDVTKIDKARIFDGQKGKYIDLTTFIDLDQQDQYGNNGFVSQSVSKEEREQGVKTPILGNVKVFMKGDGSQQPNQATQPAQTVQQPQGFDDFDDDIPF